MPAWVGIEVLPVDKDVVVRFKLPCKRGLLVRKVYIDSPAQDAGLKKGDIIRRVGNSRILDDVQLKKIVDKMKPGQALRLVLWRPIKPKTIFVEVEPKPQFLASSNVRAVAYSNAQPMAYPQMYQPPINRPYPYFYFGGSNSEENEEE